MNYPGNIKKTYHKIVNYGNRGMELEELINKTNEKLIEDNIAIIYKKPTPIAVVKYDYNSKRITDAYYQTQSTLDYNGIYKGYYIEFDAKNTNQNNLPLSNIADHQIKHIKSILNHKGIVFLMIMISSEIFVLDGSYVIDFINNNQRKSIPYEYIKNNGIKVDYNYLKGINYIPAIEELIRRTNEKEN